MHTSLHQFQKGTPTIPPHLGSFQPPSFSQLPGYHPHHKNGQISSDLFEKKLHLYLYLPRALAHPPGILKGLIAGSILRIVRLTSNPHTRKRHLQNFYRQLLARGYTRTHVLPIFNKYLRQYYRPSRETPATPPGPTSPTDHRDTVFLHLPFHPLNPPSTQVQ